MSTNLLDTLTIMILSQLLKTHLVNQRLCLWLVTTELNVEIHRMLVTALLQYLIAELICYLLREDALLLEV